MTHGKERLFDDPTFCANILGSIFIHYARTIAANDPHLGERALAAVRRQVIAELMKEPLSDTDLASIVALFSLAASDASSLDAAVH